jgi:hypothetical protein
MVKTFGFSQDELKLLLVAVRQMRRSFATLREGDPSICACAELFAAGRSRVRLWDCGAMTNDGGALLLRETDRRLNLNDREQLRQDPGLV